MIFDELDIAYMKNLYFVLHKLCGFAILNAGILTVKRRLQS